MQSLDEAYEIGAYTPGSERYPPKWEAAASAFRAALGPRAELGLSYGDSARKVFDFFKAEGPARGTLVFVHGGYWKSFDRSSWSHLGAGALASGWAAAVPEYDLCPDVRISEITAQIAVAVSRIAERTQGPIALAGHSAGGHLVARMLDPLVLPETVRSRISHVAPIAPLADLRPLMQTQKNEILRLDAAEAAAESPVNMPRPQAEVKIWVGADERPALLEQAEALSKVWGAQQVIVPARHHFDIIEALETPDSDMMQFLTGR